MNTAILDHPEVDRLIELSLAEDGVRNDLTTLATGVDETGKNIRATIVVKKTAVSAGFPIIERVLKVAGMTETIKASALVAEGTLMTPNTPWVIFSGRAGDLLRVERTILNFLMRMCGIATYANAVAKAIAGTQCKLLHTRKTAPGHRRSDIYAALAGGAHPHRRSLDDAILVKENHIRVAKSFQDLVDGINKYREQAAFVEIEVTNFTELKYAMTAKPNRIMLDNFDAKDVERAVNLFGSAVELEASGMISLESASTYAKTGVDYISMGSLTHSAPAADLSLLFDYTNL